MRLNKTNLFLLIWVVHILIYSTAYHISIRIAFKDFREFFSVFLGFLSGFAGWFEQIPFFFLIPLLLMLVLIKTKLKNQWLLTYILSTSIAYLGNYLWMFSINTHNKILFSAEQINLIYFIVPSLLTSILCNWLIFKNYYKKLKV